MRFAYADPPYPGQSWRHYGRDQRRRPAHPDFRGEVDHAELLERLERDYDGWALHTNVPGLLSIATLLPPDVRVCAWVKKWAAHKRGVGVAYAWEPVIVKPCRKRSGPEGTAAVVRDWLATMPTFQTGVAGVKPHEVCAWIFEIAGLHADDDLADLYPGSGAVARAWEAWRRSPPLPTFPPSAQEALPT